MGLFESVGIGIASGIGQDAVTASAKSAAAAAGSVEHELDVVDGPQPAALWSPLDYYALQSAGLEDDQAKVIATLLRARDTELERILEAIRADANQSYVQPFWFAAGDGRLQRQFPELPGDGGWTLDSILAWTDPAAAGDATVTLTVGGVLQIPLRVTATRANPANLKIELPVGNSSGLSTELVVAAGAGGAATDRVAVLFKFKRGG